MSSGRGPSRRRPGDGDTIVKYNIITLVCYLLVAGGGRHIGVFYMCVRVVVCVENASRPAGGHAKERDGAQRPTASPGRGSSDGVGAQQGPHRPSRSVFLRRTRVQRLVHVRTARQVHRK